ncbi:AEC family transporter [Aneurinibacillus terranovensis]|uniref:AEC family transporter n=1 Tax=Aneurinibacillus terranovensis TaxID=278991 RepID=UPI00042884E5|nr:AEC family transporter [Aneurinibacillus terranovensis]
MEVSTVLSSIAIMTIMIGIGSLLTLRVPFTAERRELLMTLIVNVALPFIIISGVFHTRMDGQFLLLILGTFVISIIVNCIGIAMGWLAARSIGAGHEKVREMAILSGLGNTGFIGLPLCAMLFGAKGGVLAAVFDSGLDFTIWTLGVMMLQRKKFSFRSLKELINIPMMAIVTGLLVAVLKLSPPFFLIRLSDSLASLASPLAMIYIGMLIPSLLRKKSASIRQIGMPLIMKLLIFPVVIALLVHIVPLHKEITQVVIVQSTMPTISLASILFARYSADEEYGAMATVFSTLLSMMTIPFMIAVGFYILK